MYQAKAALFLYCVSPVHMGAGTAVGLIDNPVQRERHTEWPLFAGSGLKGALRHRLWASLSEDDRKRSENLLNRLFGPEAGNSNLHAGAVSLGDAQLLAFPVRCTRRAYVYATSPTALARTRRLLAHALDGGAPAWPELELGADRCAVTNPDLLDDGEKLHLEVFQLQAQVSTELKTISEWLAERALPSGDAYDFFREKIRNDLVVLPDEDFGYFNRNATVVEPHVRINNETGAAEGTGLFYTENLPPESLLVAPLMTTRERSTSETKLEAEAVLDTVLRGAEGLPGLDGQLVQVGGDATTGRGQILVKALEG